MRTPREQNFGCGGPKRTSANSLKVVNFEQTRMRAIN
jgi:hypothetical protein